MRRSKVAWAWGGVAAGLLAAWLLAQGATTSALEDARAREAAVATAGPLLRGVGLPRTEGPPVETSPAFEAAPEPTLPVADLARAQDDPALPRRPRAARGGRRRPGRPGCPAREDVGDVGRVADARDRRRRGRPRPAREGPTARGYVEDVVAGEGPVRIEIEELGPLSVRREGLPRAKFSLAGQ